MNLDVKRRFVLNLIREKPRKTIQRIDVEKIIEFKSLFTIQYKYKETH